VILPDWRNVRRLKMIRFVVWCFIGGFLMLSPQFANAQISGQGMTLSASDISAFQANPGQLLSQFPDGGPGLVKQVRDLVSSDRTTLAAIIALAKPANQDQRKAIAQALAQVAKAYAKDDPASSNQIQQAVVNSGLPEFAKAYAEAAGDTGTASTGGGGGGGGGPINGPPIGGPNGVGIGFGNTAVTNGANLGGVIGLGNPSCSNCGSQASTF
jgi:hypothetical protein